MPAEDNRQGGIGQRWATGGTRATPPYWRWGGALALCFLTGWLAAVPGWAESLGVTSYPSRFRLWHDLQDVFTLTWGGARTAFALPTLTYGLPAAALIGGASLADDEVQAHFAGHDEGDPLAQAGKDYALLYYGPAQAGMYIAGAIVQDPKLAVTGKKTLAALLGTQSVVQPLKYLTRRRRPDGSNRLAFPSADASAVSSIIPSVYADYGLVPATVTAASAAFVGVARIYGNKHHLSDVLAGYAIGVGWGILVETYQRRQLPWTLLPLSDGRTIAGVVLHWRF
jgi:membrane-associated phospholipid phosphatase